MVVHVVLSPHGVIKNGVICRLVFLIGKIKTLNNYNFHFIFCQQNVAQNKGKVNCITKLVLLKQDKYF